MNMFKLDLPPYMYLMQVVRHYPLAAATYIEVWRQKDKNCKLSIPKNQIRNQFLVTPAKFRNDLYNLAQEGLINVQETWNTDQTEWWRLDIEIVNYEEEHD